MKLTLVTPNKKILTDAEVEEVFVPAYRGELNILPGHAALVTSLSSGILKYRFKGETHLHAAAISWGYCEVFHDNVSVLADSAELSEEINATEAREVASKTEQELIGADHSPEEMLLLYKKLKREQTRLQLLEEFSHGATDTGSRKTATH